MCLFEHDGFWQPMDTSREYQAPERPLRRGEGALGAMNMRDALASFSGKRVLVTGHTGFKGSWLAFLLKEIGRRGDGVRLAAGAGAEPLRVAQAARPDHARRGGHPGSGGTRLRRAGVPP